MRSKGTGQDLPASPAEQGDAARTLPEEALLNLLSIASHFRRPSPCRPDQFTGHGLRGGGLVPQPGRVVQVVGLAGLPGGHTCAGAPWDFPAPGGALTIRTSVYAATGPALPEAQ